MYVMYVYVYMDMCIYITAKLIRFFVFVLLVRDLKTLNILLSEIYRFTFVILNCFIGLNQYTGVMSCTFALFVHVYIVLRLLIVVLTVQLVCLV